MWWSEEMRELRAWKVNFTTSGLGEKKPQLMAERTLVKLL